MSVKKIIEEYDYPNNVLTFIMPPGSSLEYENHR